MKTRLGFLLAAACVSLLPAPAGSAVPAEAPIRAQVERFVPAWNSHDMAALARLFAEDADFVNVVGIWWTSRGEIERAHQATHRTMFRSSVLSGRIASLKLIRGDVAVVHFAWNLVGALTPDGQPVPERKGILVFVLSQEAGAWTIRAAQNTDIVEGALAPPIKAK